MVYVINNRNELLTKYRNDNLFIEAGAGAGKTQFISDKLIDLLLQGVELKKIVLITFTNKAAEEMLTRISNNIADKIKDLKNKEDKERLINAQNKLFELNVSTIHSFCNKLINENSFDAKVCFNPTLLEEDDESKRQDKYFTSFIKSLKKEDYEIINRLEFYSSNIFMIKKKYQALCSHLPDESFNENVVNENELILALDKADKMYRLLAIKKIYGLSKGANNFYNAYEELLNVLPNNSYDNKTIIKLLSSPIIAHNVESVINYLSKSIAINVSKTSGITRLEINNDNQELNKLRITDDDKDTILTYKDKYINQYALKAYRYYNDCFNRDELSNNYLIYLAYKLLSSSSNKIKDTLAHKYDVIIVDEFQDTDRFQIRFIDALTSLIDKRKKQEGNLTTSLVVVGDPKQSIYRFRGADINSFMDYKLHSLVDKKNLLLPQNFRSNNYIINYINDIYGNNNKDFYHQYVYENMVVAPNNDIDISKIKDTSNKLAGVYSFAFNLPGDISRSIKDKALRKLDPDDKKIRLVRLIDYLVKHHYQIYKSKDNKLGFYDIDYGDFLILTHSKKDISDIVDLFNKANIKSEVAGQFDLSSSEMFNAVYPFIAYALDPSENNKNNLRVYYSMLNSNISFEDFLNSFNDEIKGLSPYSVLMYATHQLINHDIFISNFTKSDISLYNFVIYEIIEHLNINTDVDAIHLLNELDDLLLNMPEQQISINQDDNPVRIMNVHKAKGLEGNIVILFDSGGSMNSDVISSYKNENYLNAKAYGEVTMHNIAIEKKNEKVRLEYVAMSRAKSVLILEERFSPSSNFFSFQPDGAMNDDLSDYYDFTGEAVKSYHLINTSLPKLSDIYACYPSLNEKVINTPKSFRLDNNTFKLDNLDIIKKPQIHIYSPSSKENREECVNIVSTNIKRPRNNIFGDMMHRSLELLINDYDKNITSIAIQAFNEHSDIDKLDKDYYVKYLVKVIKAIKTLYDNDPNFIKYKKYPEYKFTSFIKEDNSIINGSMDLLLIKDNDIKIIDYKSDIAGFIDHESFSKILISRYIDQVKLYKKVVSNLYPKSNIDVSLIYVSEKDDEETAHEIKVFDN